MAIGTNLFARSFFRHGCTNFLCLRVRLLARIFLQELFLIIPDYFMDIPIFLASIQKFGNDF
jgi:hypothetical protein